MASGSADVALDLAAALDAAVLAERAGVLPDEWQARLLRSDARQIALLCSRQAGKSTITALVALREALYGAPALVLLLSPSLRQSQELFRKVKEALAALGADAAPVEEESALRAEFANGSRIICLPGKQQTVRGYSGVSLLVVDEAAQVDDGLYMAIRPMLAVSGGRIVLLSTPFGTRGFFHREWAEGGPDWERVKITAYQVPRISPAWLDRERQRIGDWWFKQEYLCEFVQADDQVFRDEDIAAALVASIFPLFPDGAPGGTADPRPLLQEVSRWP